MRAPVIAFAAAAAIATVLTPVIRGFARRRGLLDHALTSRKIHRKPIPRLGRVAIVVAFYLPLLFLGLAGGGAWSGFQGSPARAVGLLAGGLGIALLGLVDDLRGVRPRHKLAVQVAIATVAYALGFRVDQIANPFGPPIPLGAVGLPFTVLWITGVVNAMNLLDGLDGLAGGIALVAASTLFALAGFHGDQLMLLCLAALGGAALGFLFFNFNPASIFMGDTGSMFLGFVLATTGIATSQAPSAAVSILVPIVALGLPIGDTLLAMARRAASGVPMSQPDRGHVHHRLLDLGLSHRRAVLVLYGAAAVLGVSALALSSLSSWPAALLLAAVCALSCLFLRRLGFFDPNRAQAMLAQRRRNLELRAAIRRIGDMLGATETPWDVWVAVRFAAAPLGACAIALHLADPASAASEDFTEGFLGASRGLLRKQFGLEVERPGTRRIELGWADGRMGIDRDTEIAVELLCEHIACAVDRIERGRERPQQGDKVVRLPRVG